MPATFCRDRDDLTAFNDTISTVDADCADDTVCRLKGPFSGRDKRGARVSFRRGKELFLTYQDPLQRRNPVVGTSVDVTVVFGRNVDPPTFSATAFPGRVERTDLFLPVIAGTARTVSLPLSERKRTRFRFEILGERSYGKIRKDRDMLVFIW